VLDPEIVTVTERDCAVAMLDEAGVTVTAGVVLEGAVTVTDADPSDGP
jgi:hypothetical protein